jgi:hypothetical protein
MELHGQVTSNDPALQAAVNQWLLDSRMGLPVHFRIDLQRVAAIDPWDDPREAYVQGDTEIRSGEPLDWAHFSWRPAGARARVEADRPEATIEVTGAALEQLDYLLRTFLLVVLIFLWKRAGRYHVHAGTAVDSKGRGWMLIGNSCSGKSTTTALLASRGWQVSTDDIAFLTARDDRAAVIGFRSRIALRPGGYALVNRAGGLPLASRGKTGFWPEELGATWVQTVEPEILVFTSVGGERTRFEPISPGEVLSELLQWSVWVMLEPTAAQQHLDLLSQLGRQARCYRATFAPDLFDAPGALEDFLP